MSASLANTCLATSCYLSASLVCPGFFREAVKSRARMLMLRQVKLHSSSNTTVLACPCSDEDHDGMVREVFTGVSSQLCLWHRVSAPNLGGLKCALASS